MKKNPELAKELLERALKELPGDNALSNVRWHMRKAINEIEKVTGRRTAIAEQQKKQKSPWQQWKLNLETGTLMNPALATSALGGIESLIAQEQAKLAAIQNKNKTPEPQSTETSEEDEFLLG